MPQWKALFDTATAARKKAHAPYSNFHVGVALECTDGSIIGGINVENASYGLTVCAERNAMARAVYEGKTVIAAAIVTDAKWVTPPCGMCRQVLAEFCPPTLPIHSRTLAGEEAKYTLGELLPHAFSGEWLKTTKPVAKKTTK